MSTKTDGSRLATDVSLEEQLDWLRAMHEIRFFEEEVQDLFTKGVVRGSTHLCQGQEAVSVGACRALESGDTMACTYRGHGAVLAMGAPLDRSFAEIMGKAEGLCGGKGGSMHLTDMEVGALGSFAIIGAHLPIVCGAALAASRTADGVSLCFFGDGTVNIGAFHEALNLASVWKLPAIFLCENNLYGEYSPIATTTRSSDLVDRAASYGMRGVASTATTSASSTHGPGGGRARPRRRRPDLHRGADVPPPRPLALGPGAVPADGRAGGVARARPDRADERALFAAGVEDDALEALRRAPGRGARGARARDRAGPTRPPRHDWSTSAHEHDDHHLPRRDRPGARRRHDGGRGRLPARRGRRRRGRPVQADRGAVRAVRPASACATRRSPSRRSSARRSARRSRACGRSPRSCSPTSRASASTASPTRWPSTAT